MKNNDVSFERGLDRLLVNTFSNRSKNHSSGFFEATGKTWLEPMPLQCCIALRIFFDLQKARYMSRWFVENGFIFGQLSGTCRTLTSRLNLTSVVFPYWINTEPFSKATFACVFLRQKSSCLFFDCYLSQTSSEKQTSQPLFPFQSDSKCCNI